MILPSGEPDGDSGDEEILVLEEEGLQWDEAGRVQDTFAIASVILYCDKVWWRAQ